MEPNLPAICAELKIHVDAGAVLVNSRDVAEMFEKRHDHVLRDIKDLEISPELGRSWFRETTSLDTYGREQPSIDLTKDGFVLLVMGWTGEKANRFKIRYIEAFNAMEQALKERPGITTHAEFIEAIREIVRPLAIRFDDQDTAINRVEEKVDRLDSKVEALEEHLKKKIKSSAKRYERRLIYITAKYYGGKCPVTGKQLLDAGNQRIPFASEIDHFYETAGTDITNFWLVATEINQGIAKNRIPRDTVEHHFKGFQDKLRKETTGDQNVVKFPKKPRQPSLF
jgi:Rha family phage regulatory protein